MVTKCDRVERDRLMLALVLIVGSVVFFTLFEQAGTSLNQFAERNTNLALINAPDASSTCWASQVFLGTRAMSRRARRRPERWWIDMGFDAAQTQSFNAGFILIFAPVFAALWAWLGRRGRDPNPVVKFGLGLVQVGLGFLVLVWSAGLRRRRLPPAADGPGLRLSAAHHRRAVPRARWACRRSPSSRRPC